jgi:hypothetical protein
MPPSITRRPADGRRNASARLTRDRHADCQSDRHAVTRRRDSAQARAHEGRNRGMRAVGVIRFNLNAELARYIREQQGEEAATA